MGIASHRAANLAAGRSDETACGLGESAKRRGDPAVVETRRKRVPSGAATVNPFLDGVDAVFFEVGTYPQPAMRAFFAALP